MEHAQAQSTISVPGARDEALVREFLAALPADLPGTAEKFGSDDMVWVLPPSVPGGGRPWTGKPAVVKLLRQMQAGFEAGSMRLEVREIVGQGNSFAVRHAITAKSKAGKPYENEYAFFITLRDGKIAQVLEYVDTAKVLAVFA